MGYMGKVSTFFIFVCVALFHLLLENIVIRYRRDNWIWKYEWDWKTSFRFLLYMMRSAFAFWCTFSPCQLNFQNARNSVSVITIRETKSNQNGIALCKKHIYCYVYKYNMFWTKGRNLFEGYFHVEYRHKFSALTYTFRQ